MRLPEVRFKIFLFIYIYTNFLYQTPEQSDIGPPRAAETLIGTSLDIPDEMIPHLKVHNLIRKRCHLGVISQDFKNNFTGTNG